MIKLIAIDMDGTLLDSNNRLPNGFLDLVAKLSDQGVTTVIATGRQYYNVIKFVEPILDKMWIASENGAMINKGSELVHVYAMDKELLAPAIEDIKTIPEAHYIECTEQGAFVDCCPPHVEAEIRTIYERLLSSDDAYEHSKHLDICKVAINAPDAASMTMPVVKKYEKDFNVVLSGLHWVDLMTKGVDKGDAISYIQKYLGVSKEETICFGDYPNDLGLFRVSGESYAMANAHPDVKAVSTHFAPSNNEGGVQVILEQLYNEGKFFKA